MSVTIQTEKRQQGSTKQPTRTEASAASIELLDLLIDASVVLDRNLSSVQWNYICGGLERHSSSKKENQALFVDLYSSKMHHAH